MVFLTIFVGIYPPNTFANNTALLRGHNIILYSSLGFGRLWDINYTLKPIFLRVFPFLVMEPDVFGRYAILNMITNFLHGALHAVSIYQPSQRVSDEYY